MKNILIIGGAGYVGSVVTSHFLRKGYKVKVLDNLIYNNHDSVIPFLGDPNYTFMKGNMGNSKLLEDISHGVSDVVILGGLVGDPITRTFPDESKKINDDEVQRCILYFTNKEIDKLIFVSTCSNYGLIKDNELADEDFVLNPLSLYSKSKVAAEEILMSVKNQASSTGVILRFATAFGLSPRMRFDLSLSEFVRDIYFGNELNVFDENTWRPYCHVRDFARLIDLVIHAPKEKVNFQVFNAGGDVNNATKKMIVDKILQHIPEGRVTYGINGSDPRNYKVSFNKVKSVLSFEPQFTIDFGIKELISAFRMGFYANSKSQRDRFGNYSISFQ